MFPSRLHVLRKPVAGRGTSRAVWAVWAEWREVSDYWRSWSIYAGGGSNDAWSRAGSGVPVWYDESLSSGRSGSVSSPGRVS